MNYMFANYHNLRTIYGPEVWSIVNLPGLAIMFSNSHKLIGGAGTTYDHSCISQDYACIDGLYGRKGYFASIADKPTA